MDMERLAVVGVEEWQLLKAVQPIFAHRPGHILGPSDKGTLLNLETIYDFEVWLLPSTLREAFDCGLPEYSPQGGSQVLMAILHSFEKSVAERALAFDLEGKFANRVSKVSALTDESLSQWNEYGLSRAALLQTLGLELRIRAAE